MSLLKVLRLTLHQATWQVGKCTHGYGAPFMHILLYAPDMTCCSTPAKPPGEALNQFESRMMSSGCDDLTLLPIPHVWHMPFLLRLQRISSALVAPLSDLKQDKTDSATSAIQFFWQSRQCPNMFTHVSDWSSTYSVIVIGHWTEVPESLVLVFAIAGPVKPDCQLQGWIWPL